MPRPKAEILDELAAVSEELQRAENLAKQRDELVIEATRADASRSEVGRAAGVSRGRVQQIVTEARKEAEMKKTKRTQAGLAVIALVAGVGAALALSSAGDDDLVTDSASQMVALSYAELRNADVDPQVKWLASVMVKEERKPFDAQNLEFICAGISDDDAQSMSLLLKQPITDESLSVLNENCPDH